jgi:hypothetical protein
MFLFVMLILGLSVVSAIVGISLRKGQVARRAESLRQAAGLLGIRYMDGDEAYLQAKKDSAAEGLEPQQMPEALERYVRKLTGPRLAGLFRGVQVAVYEEVHTSNNGSHTESVFKAYFSSALPFQLRLAREGAGAKIAKAFGGQDVATGYEVFDAAVRIKSSEPEAAVRFLQDEGRRKAVLTALEAYPSAVVCRTHVVVSRQGRLKSGDEIKAILAAIVPVAAAFSGAAEAAPADTSPSS